jgi:hypothetical protein
VKERPPDVTLGEFSLWVHGWRFKEADDEDDANWLQVAARHRSLGSSVAVDGPIIQSGDIARFLSALESLHARLSGEATLEGHEPELKIVLQALSLGRLEMIVNITPDPLNQEHRFTSEIDQSYLPDAIAALRRVLIEYGPRSRR